MGVLACGALSALPDARWMQPTGVLLARKVEVLRRFRAAGLERESHGEKVWWERLLAAVGVAAG